VIDKPPRLLHGFGIIPAMQPDETDERVVPPNPVRLVFRHAQNIGRRLAAVKRNFM
jgi:hypothetical protein